MSNSRLLVTAEEIRVALTRLKPTGVAVAYVGRGWSNYLPSGCLKELVVSPTLGSNPWAIEEIMTKLGDQNVYFLETLHAKIYLGEVAAVVGSCNLSDNGLGDTGRWEAAVLLEDAASVRVLVDTFDQYKTLAREGKYPDLKTKLSRLRDLRVQWNIAVSYGPQARSDEPPLLRDYVSRLDPIHMLPFKGACRLNEDVLGAVIPEVVSAGPWNYFLGVLAREETYKIDENDWVLCWPCNNDGRPRKNGRVSWLYAHHVEPNGADNDDYTKLIGEANAPWRTPVPRPFRLGPKTQQIIRDTLDLDEFKTLRDGEQRDAERVKDFLDYVRRAQEDALKSKAETEADF